MKIKQTVDDILINGKSILNNKYAETRKRICRYKGRNDLRDKDIIEELTKEIDYYRNKIQLKEETIKELREKQIENTSLEDKDVIEITSTTRYADGKPISTTMKYKYKDMLTMAADDIKVMPFEITSEKNMYCCGIDGGDKDYQVTSYKNNNGEIIKEKIECLNDKQ